MGQYGEFYVYEEEIDDFWTNEKNLWKGADGAYYVKVVPEATPAGTNIFGYETEKFLKNFLANLGKTNSYLSQWQKDQIQDQISNAPTEEKRQNEAKWWEKIGNYQAEIMNGMSVTATEMDKHENLRQVVADRALEMMAKEDALRAKEEASRLEMEKLVKERNEEFVKIFNENENILENMGRGGLGNSRDGKRLLQSLGKGIVENKAIERLPTSESKLKHIFRNAEGHLPDTPQNRSLVQEITTDLKNYLGKDKYGNDWYAATLKDGRQVWVQSRNGEIWDGGLNNKPRNWNDQTGLKNLQPLK